MSTTQTQSHNESFPDPENQGQNFIGGTPTDEVHADQKNPQRAFQPQADAVKSDAASHVEFAERPVTQRPVTLKGIDLDPLRSLNTDSDIDGQGERQLTKSDGDEPETDGGFTGLVGLFQSHGKVLIGAIVCAVVGLALWPSKVPMPVPTTAPVAMVAPTPVVTAPMVADPAGDALIMPTGGIDMHGNMNSPDEQSRLASEMLRETQAIPLAEQVCSNSGITSFDQMRCTQVGQVQYFKCASDGRRWDVRKPGCENG